MDGQRADWRTGRVSPPTAVAYQTVDQLSPMLHEQAFPSEPLHSSGERSKPRFKKVRSNPFKCQFATEITVKSILPKSD